MSGAEQGREGKGGLRGEEESIFGVPLCSAAGSGGGESSAVVMGGSWRV